MLVSDVQNKDLLSGLIIRELKDLGVKHRKEKKSKIMQDKTSRKRIFRMPLHLLELTDVILASGGIVQVPKFVSETCQRILENVETEGLFRKGGSALRQKEIKSSLEAGIPLGRSHHVIDVANVLKSFFRELPDPLLAPCIQETLLRSLLCGEENINAVMMSCLLLPPLTAYTLAFFMQFLHTVSLSSHLNKMSVENLAIIFTPGIMPLSDIVGIRFNNHVKVVQLLITYANMICILPQKILEKLHVPIISSPGKVSSETEKKKKKRRSGSLTRMFNGIRKMVGAIGSSENLDNSPERQSQMATTPCLSKSAKKRKLSEASAFSSKKKKDLLSLFPENGGLLPNTPICKKETKKSRLSLGGRRNIKSSSNNATNNTSNNKLMERRWSVVGSSWARKKQNIDQTIKETTRPLSPVVSMPCITNVKSKAAEPTLIIYKDSGIHTSPSLDESYVRIPKSEYESIKERVSAIETRISQEFSNVNDCLFSNGFNESNQHLSGPERVLDKFERTLEETENITSPSTEQLAKRLSRDLKIRRSDEQRIFRSPSARKIGTIRRRSKENVKLSRNKTWHITANNNIEKSQNQHFVTSAMFYPKSNLKRGRPNTVQTGLHHPSPLIKDDSYEINGKETWTSAEMFFNCTDDDTPPTVSTPHKDSCKNEYNISTPVFIKNINIDETKTPMLPPTSVPRKFGSAKTPSSATRLPETHHHDLVSANKNLLTPIQEGLQGRASIARLRSQNAGMVMAKAKLFDGLNNETDKPIQKTCVPNDIKRRSYSNSFNKPAQTDANIDNKCSSVITPKSNKDKINGGRKTPRRKYPPKSPGCVQKRQKQCFAKNHNNLAINDFLNEEELLFNRDGTRNNPLNKVANVNKQMDSPRRTPKLNKSLRILTSPIKVGRTPKKPNMSHKTPMKATHTHVRNAQLLKL